MNISNVFSTRNISLVVFILIVLFLGTMFNVQVSHESFVEGATRMKISDKKSSDNNSSYNNSEKKSSDNNKQMQQT